MALQECHRGWQQELARLGMASLTVNLNLKSWQQIGVGHNAFKFRTIQCEASKRLMKTLPCKTLEYTWRLSIVLICWTHDSILLWSKKQGQLLERLLLELRESPCPVLAVKLPNRLKDFQGQGGAASDQLHDPPG